MASTLTSQRNLGSISTKEPNVALNPFQCENLVEQAGVYCTKAVYLI